MAISIFETRTMLEALEMMLEPKTFLVKTFFGRTVEFPTEAVDVDVYKGKRRVAIYVNPKAEGQKVDRVGYKTNTYKPPYVKPKMPTTAEDILKRLPGEVLYANNMSNEQRAAAQLLRDMAEIDGIISRREEQQAAEVLLNGTLDVNDIDGNAIVDQIDFGRESTHTVDLTATGATPWNATGADPFKDIRTWGRLIAQDAGVIGNIAILGSEAVDAFLANEEVQKQLNKQIASVGQIEMAAQEMGVTYIGRIAGVDYYAYDEWYLDQTVSPNVENPMIPVDSVLFGSTMARCERLYGAIRDVEAGLAAVQRFPKTWIENDPSVRWLQIHSAPLCCPTQVDGFVKAKVVA